MEPLGLLLVLAVAGLVVFVLTRSSRGGRPPEGAGEEAEHRVSALCARLTGEAPRDRALLNRILSLGPGIIPQVIEELAETLREPEGVQVARLAALEELVADFGLAAVSPIAARLARVQPMTPLASSLTRVLRRLGAPGAVAFLREGLTHPELALFLPRWRLAAPGRDPEAMLLAALRDRPAERRRADLEALTGLLADHPEVVDTLWSLWDEAGRVVLLEWLADWFPMADGGHVRAALADESAAVRVAGAALAALLADAGAAAEGLAAMAGEADPRSRAAAVAALARLPGSEAALWRAARDGDPDVAVEAMLGLLRDREGARRALEGATALAADPRGALLRALLAGEAPDVGALLEALDGPALASRVLAITLLGTVPEDPRARERLILLADAREGPERAAAVAALAQGQDSTAPDLLGRAVRESTEPADVRRLQHAAQRLGPAALLPLARRIRSEAPERVDIQLTLLRAQPYAGAVAPLLRALEGVRLSEVEGAITATLHAGGADVQATLRDCLLQPGRGLLTPTLRYLGGYATPADLPMLVDLFDRHPPLRAVLLNLIEAQGAPAAEVLAERVRRGGEDAVLAALEQRLKVVRACA